MLKELINGLLEIIIDPSPRANLREKPKEDKLNYVEVIYEVLDGQNIHEYLYVENDIDVLAKVRLESDLERRVREIVTPKNVTLHIDPYNRNPKGYIYKGHDMLNEDKAFVGYHSLIREGIKRAIATVKKETKDTTLERRLASMTNPDGSIRFDNLEFKEEAPEKETKTYANRSEYVINEIINKRSL